MPESWRRFFEGLSDDENLVYEDLKGPSWSPGKNKKPSSSSNNQINEYDSTLELNQKSIKQASKDSVRAIMLIRAWE